MAIFRLTQNRKSAPSGVRKPIKGKRREIVAARLGAVIGAAHADRWRAEMPDDRRSPRAQTNHVASALIGAGETATCRVVNKGVAGLRLQLLEDKECPEEFGLTIPALRFVGIVRREWRRGADIGVSIL
ncbi:MAG TPA: hypothetical protein PKM48_04040 [Parvularculaceae bacterium]|nr:hypothetical protein [Parvularculaceae bacterium]HNS86236.1 hypothetical protein [Parvularculaceae bacterium]